VLKPLTKSDNSFEADKQRGTGSMCADVKTEKILGLGVLVTWLVSLLFD
jgi:hypothetical protein